MIKFNFDFGNGPKRDGSVRVRKTDVFCPDKGYGFLGVSRESAELPKIIDGYYQDGRHLTVLSEREGGVFAGYGDAGHGVSGYGSSSHGPSEDGSRYPLRFAVKVPPNTYYRVKVTMAALGGDACITLTSERRHFILTKEQLMENQTLTKTFTVAVHDVKWKNRDHGKVTPTVYRDDLLNLCLMGKHAALCRVEIEQIEKPRVLWIFGDSTVCDSWTGIPYSGFDTATGWGAAAAKYLTEETAVVNLAEGGLNTGDTDFFELGKNDMEKGDVLLLQMGHNERSAEQYLERLEYYRRLASDTGVKLVLCSPIHRLTAGQKTLPWPMTDVDSLYAPAARVYARTKGISFIDLNALTRELDHSLDLIKPWYLHGALWEEKTDETPDKITFLPHNDATHINDFGADIICHMVMEQLALITEGLVRPGLPAPMTPSESIIKDSEGNYRMPPYEDAAFPYRK